MTCEVCGDKFRAHGQRAGTAKFCSVRCKGIASRVAFSCEVCGKVTHGIAKRTKRWCSRQCSAVARRRGEERTCEQCSAGFYLTANRIAKGQGKFCSLACHNEHQGRAKTTHTCKTCGDTFRWSPSRSNSGAYRITYCSLSCRDADPARRELLLRMNALQLTGRMTRAEAAGYALLEQLGLDYRRQAVFAGKFIPDAVVPAARLVVQFDGDYWHDRAGTSTEPRIVRRVATDRSQDAYVRACGWEVARLWASDLSADPEGCAALISQLAHRPLAAAPARDPLARASGRNAAVAPT